METMQGVKAKVARGKPEKKEIKVATAIVDQKARIPSDILFWATVGFMAVSLGFKVFKKGNAARFLDQWAPTAVLLLGIYNKLSKQSGHSSKS